MSNSSFDFNEFVRESKETLLNPKSYFAGMRTSGGMVEPLIKAVLYGAIAGVIALLWSVIGIGSVTGSAFGGALGAMALVWYIVGAVIGLFIGAVILLIISSVCKGSTDFEANARVTASAMVILPISALLSFTMGINLYLGLIINLAVNLFTLWLLYNGLVESLKARPDSCRIVMFILAALLVLFMLIGLGTKNRVEKYLDNYDRDLKEMMKDLDND
ncbi:MAG: YIP1 family protein [Bacteroidales bacterium]|nr:YIP1 family protein [Bacteroidales bacterium]